MIYCKECGKKISVTATSCPHCGANFEQQSQKNKTTAGLLALFLGGIGIHKFYLGKNGQGVVYLLFCWTLIPSIIALIEAIIYFSQSNDEFQQKYGSSHILNSNVDDFKDKDEDNYDPDSLVVYCDHCKSAIDLDKDEEVEFYRYGSVKIDCPLCHKKITISKKKNKPIKAKHIED